MGRSWFFPPDDVTVGEWHYLMRRYPADEAAERRERLGQTLKRLVRKGHDPAQVHRALMVGIHLWHDHAGQQMGRKAARELNAKIARAHKDVDRALASLRRLLPTTTLLSLDDDDLFALRDLLLAPVKVPQPKQPRGGRPWAGNGER